MTKDKGASLRDRATREPSRAVSALRAGIASAWRWWRPIAHIHEWHDWYVFDSSAVVSTGRPEIRVVGQQIMMLCVCGATKRKHLETWQEARIARKRLPYKRWGTGSFTLAVPDALMPEQSQ